MVQTIGLPPIHVAQLPPPGSLWETNLVPKFFTDLLIGFGIFAYGRKLLHGIGLCLAGAETCQVRRRFNEIIVVC